MGSDQQFCLRWNNFQNNIISSFEYLRSEEDFVDVTLACEGRSLKAHKVILSACSQYFRDLLKTTPCQHPIIVLKDVCYEDLLSLMCFVYQGVVYIGQERLTQFLKTAEFLQIKGLSENNIGDSFGGRSASSQSIPALTPIGVTPPSSATSAPPPSYSPQPRSSRSTPSPSPSFKETSPQSTTAKRRKPLFPLHAFMPSQNSEALLSASCESPGGPSQSSPTEQTTGSDTVPPPPSFLATTGSNGGVNCQEVALSLVTETSILRQRIEGSSPLGSIKLENNGVVSPCPTSLSDLQLPTPLLLDPNALSMVGRDSIGFPFLTQPSTSSLLATSTAHEAQMLMNSAASSPTRYRQRWRCMQPSMCPHCMRTFSNAFNLKQHIINVHTFGNELKCDVCGKVQKNKWYLRKHMVKSHNAPLRRVKLPDGTMVNTESGPVTPGDSCQSPFSAPKHELPPPLPRVGPFCLPPLSQSPSDELRSTV